MHSKVLQREVVVKKLSSPDKVLPLGLITISSGALGILKLVVHQSRFVNVSLSHFIFVIAMDPTSHQ